MEEVNLTVSYTVKVTGDNEKTAQEKAALIIENMQGQANAVRYQFDTGVDLNGTVNSDDTEVEEVNL